MNSSNGLQYRGNPSSQQERNYFLFQYCGGKGGGDCIFQLSDQGAILSYKLPRYITYNRKIVLYNQEVFGVRIFDDGGVSGLCDHSIGNEQDWWIALAADGGLDVEATAKAGKLMNGALPYEIEFAADECPQPINPAWEARLYVYIWWGNPTFVNEGGFVTEDSFKIVKHDYEVKI